MRRPAFYGAPNKRDRDHPFSGREAALKKICLVSVCIALLVVMARLGWGQQGNQHPRGTTLPDFAWQQSLPIRPSDPAITPIGGTEVRALAAFDKKLFAAIGYWMDTEKSVPELPGAQVLRLDSPSSEWKIDLELDESGPRGMRLYQAISNLQALHFTTDAAGQRLSEPADFLLAGVWKRGIGLDVFARVAGNGPSAWSRMAIPGEEMAARGTQARSFFLHRDTATGVDTAFIGATGAIIAGGYDAGQKQIVWKSSPEWQADSVPKLGGAGRVSSFAEANGKLYAAVYGTILQRIDGANPAWKKVYETTINLPKVTGLRGLTAIANPIGPGEVLLAGVEDNPARVYRIDPHNSDGAGMYASTLELEVSSFVGSILGTPVTYAGIAYNDTIAYPDPGGKCAARLLGIETITREAARTFGRQHFNANGYYLVRDCKSRYELREVWDRNVEPKPDLVAVRAFAISPFSSDISGTVYAGGFDANSNPVHNTAWLYKGVPAKTAQ
jgi:hypothetical protein